MPSARLTPPTPTQDTGPPTHTSQPHTGHHGRGRGVPVGGVPVGGGRGYRQGGYQHREQDSTKDTTHQHAPSMGQARATPPTATGPDDMRHTHPTPGATGAHLSALQPTPKPAHAPTTDKPPAAHTRTHSHTAATTTNHHSTSHHDHQSQPPRPRSTNTRGHEHEPQQHEQHTTL